MPLRVFQMSTLAPVIGVLCCCLAAQGSPITDSVTRSRNELLAAHAQWATVLDAAATGGKEGKTRIKAVASDRNGGEATVLAERVLALWDDKKGTYLIDT